MPARRRVLALGFAEATWTLLRSFAADLPTLTRMRAEGACGSTLAPQPLTYAPMWAAVVTGRTASGARTLSAADLGAPTVWRLLEKAGVPTGGFNLYAIPQEPVTGFMLTRGDAPSLRPDMVHPAPLYRHLRERFGAWATASSARTPEEWASVPAAVDTRADVFIELLGTRPWSFALAQFPDVGRAQHMLWDDDDIIRSLYVATDRTIARIVDAAGPETLVFVFSECGAGPIRHGVQLNAWLEREGYVRRRRGWLPHTAIAGARAYRRGARERMPRWFHQSRLKARLRAAVRDSDLRLDSRAFAPGASSDIVLNGPASAHPELEAEIRTRLLALRDPEGRRVVEAALPRPGGGVTIVWDDDAYVPAESFDERERVFVDWCPESPDVPFTGSHRREGVLMVHGRDVAPADLGRVPTVDLVPTWLELLGVPRPSGLDGASFAARLIPAR